MRKNLTAIILAISLIANLVLGATLFIKLNDKSFFEQQFLNEISFAVQRFEEYQELPSESGYIVGVAHLYSAWSRLTSIDEKEWTYKQSDDFHELWSVAALYPERFIENLDQIIQILKQIRADNDFNDIDALLELAEFNAAMRHAAK